MKQLTPELKRVHTVVAECLAELKVLFKSDMALTFIARCPTDPDQTIMVTEDDAKALAANITRYAQREAVITIGWPDIERPH